MAINIHFIELTFDSELGITDTFKLKVKETCEFINNSTGYEIQSIDEWFRTVEGEELNISVPPLNKPFMQKIIQILTDKIKPEIMQ